MIGTTIFHLGRALLAQKRYPEAIVAFEQARVDQLFNSSEKRLARPADFRSNSVSFGEKGRRDLARAASVPLKSFPKKGTHDDDIPLSLRMSGQFCPTPIG